MKQTAVEWLEQKLIEIYNFKVRECYEIEQAKEMEDDYAIEFGNWLDNNQYNRLIDGRWISTIVDFNKSFTSEELLEIFKKQKGL